jgi:hypothetical protein
MPEIYPCSIRTLDSRVWLMGHNRAIRIHILIRLTCVSLLLYNKHHNSLSMLVEDPLLPLALLHRPILLPTQVHCPVPACSEGVV